MRHRRTTILFLPVVLLLSQAASCPPKHPDPQARAAQVGMEVLQRIGEMQDVAIAANQQQAMSDADSIRVVRFTTAAARTIRQTPYGWGPSVVQAYDEIRPWLLTHPRVAPFLPLLDVLLRGVR